MAQKITACLWFDGKAEEAANFYVSVFRNARIAKISRYGEAGPGPAGSVMLVVLELDGQQFSALNGGPQFKFTEAVSLSVDCNTQAEVDYFWEKLSAGGEQGPCGWLTDPDPVKSQRVMQAMLQMKKLDIAGLERAYSNRH